MAPSTNATMQATADQTARFTGSSTNARKARMPPKAKTTTAVMVFAFGGILALRAFVDDPVKRAVWSAVACIVAFVDGAIVYFSVKGWDSLDQAQSTPQTVSSA